MQSRVEIKADPNISNEKRVEERSSPMKVNFSSTEIREKCQLLESEDQKDQTVGIFFFSKHPQYSNAEIVAKIFEISSDDEEMSLLVLQEFLNTYLKNENLSILPLTEASISDYLMQFIKPDDPFLFSLASEILVKLCNRDIEFKDSLGETSLVGDCIEVCANCISEIAGIEDSGDQEFIDNAYVIEGTFKIVELFLPECSEESAELINALMKISNPCVLSLGLDCLYKWTPKANLECFEAVFNERLQAVFHDFISTQQKHFINSALFVADSAMKRSPECVEFFIASGIAELAPIILSLSDDEIVLFLSSICSISEIDSDLTNEFIKMEGLEAIMNEVVENYSYSVFQYVFIFIINFCKRNNEEAFIFVLDNYANVLAKMIEVLNNGKCFIATNILNTYYLILDWIFSKGTSGEIYLQMLNIEGLTEAIDGLMETEVSPEVEELANEIREKLQ